MIGMLATAAAAETVPLPDAGRQAAWSCRDSCLKSRPLGADAAVASILAQAGAKEATSLQPFGSGRAMRTFVDDKRDFPIRYGKKKKYGCFVALAGDPSLSASVRQAISSFGGLTVKTVKPGKQVYFEWTINGSKDAIRLTPRSDSGSILINLEVM